jgi:Lon protease-like protein
MAMDEDAASLAGFSGTVRLFPLPNLVLFPHVVQPLHIFEPRYRQLMADALADDRLITMALLKPGWEEHYHKRPPIHPIVCVGRIFKEERLSDGRYNLLLQGLARARVVEEMTASKLYRVARVVLVPDESVVSDAAGQELRQRLGEQVERWFAAQTSAQQQLRKLLLSQLSLGALSDIFTFALPFEPEAKQELLAEAGVERRVSRLLQHLGSRQPAETAPAATSPRQFPPDFSCN